MQCYQETRGLEGIFSPYLWNAAWKKQLDFVTNAGIEMIQETIHEDLQIYPENSRFVTLLFELDEKLQNMAKCNTEKPVTDYKHKEFDVILELKNLIGDAMQFIMPQITSEHHFTIVNMMTRSLNPISQKKARNHDQPDSLTQPKRRGPKTRLRSSSRRQPGFQFEFKSNACYYISQYNATNSVSAATRLPGSIFPKPDPISNAICSNSIHASPSLANTGLSDATTSIPSI